MEIKSEITDPIAGGQSEPGLQVPTTFIFLPEHTVEKPLEACRVCLLTDCRLYSMQQCNLKDMFKQLTGLQLLDDKYPSSLCAECATFLVKCKRFREKSLTVQKSLTILSNTARAVTVEQIKRVRKLKKLSSNLSVKQTRLNYYDTEIYVSEDYEGESSTNLKGELIYTEVRRDCEDDCVKLSSDSVVIENPTSNLDKDVNVCEDNDEEEEERPTSVKSATIKTELTTGCEALPKREYMQLPSSSSVKQNPPDMTEDEKEATSIDIINGKQIKLELEIEFENKFTKREPKENPPHFSDNPYVTYPYENFEENSITSLNDNQLPLELFSDSDGNDTDQIKAETNHEQGEVNVKKEISKRKQTLELKKTGNGSKPATRTAKKSVEKPHHCEQCKKVLKSKSVYLEHLRLEHHSSQHVCCICGLSFLNRRSLSTHQSRKHVVDNSYIPDDGPCCSECSLHFLTEEALQTHLQGTLKGTRISVKESDSDFGDDFNAEISDSPENEEYLKPALETEGEEKDSDKKSTTKAIKKPVPTRKLKSRKVPLDRKTTILKNMIVVKKLTLEEQLEVIQNRKENNKDKPYKCDKCPFGTGLEKNLETHMMRHSMEMGELSCNLCHFRFKTTRAYRQHKLRHSYMYSCVECPFTTYQHHIASKHVFQFHKRQKYTCGICGKVYMNLNSYFEHKKIKHPSSQHVCYLCGYSFSSKTGVESHHRAKHLQESVEMPTLADGPSCAECSLRFMNEKALQTHMRVSHSTGTSKKLINSCYTNKSKSAVIGKKVVCETCGKLVNVYHLNSHLQEHAGKTFSCSVCGLTSGTKRGIYQHTFYTHGKGREYRKDGKPILKKKEERAQCMVCEKTYSSKRNLQKHMDRAHSGNIVPCNYCDKQFSCAENLKSHVDHVHLKKPWPKKRAR